MPAGKLVKAGAVNKKEVKAIVDRALLTSKNVENKRHRYTDQTLLGGGVTAFHNLLNASAQGDADLGSRCGDKITIKSIKVKGLIAPVTTTDYFRVVLFQWQILSSTAPTEATLFDDTSTTLGKVFGGINYDGEQSRKVMKVLFDKSFTASTAMGQVNININKKFKNGMNIQFDAASSNGYGNPFLAIISSSSNTPRIYSVVKYADL